MEILKIEEAKHKPGVLMDPDKNIINFFGYSFPEDANAFFQPIINWINQYETICEEKIKTQSSLHVSFKFTYFNTASTRAIHEIFQLLKMMKNKGLDIQLDWCYEQGDVSMLDSGKELSEITGIQANFIEYEE